MQACECCVRACVRFSIAFMCACVRVFVLTCVRVSVGRMHACVCSLCVRVSVACLHACVCSCECCVCACVCVIIASMHAGVVGVFVRMCVVFVFTTVARACVQLKRPAQHIITRQSLSAMVRGRGLPTRGLTTLKSPPTTNLLPFPSFIYALTGGPYMKEIFPRGNNKVVIYISLYHDKFLLFMLELY